jgi:hypothetical protein
MFRLLLAAALLASTAAQAKGLACNSQKLQKGLSLLEAAGSAELRMRTSANFLLSGCTGFPTAQRKALDAVRSGHPEALREHALQAFLPRAANEKTSFCPGKPFAVPYAPAPQRAAHFDACGLGERKLLSREEWTAALAPEAAYLLDEALRKAKVPAPLAASYARHFSGPGLYDALWRDPAVPRDPFEPERPDATCNQANLDEALKSIARRAPADPEQRMELAVTAVVDECRGALPKAWAEAFDTLPEMDSEDYRPFLMKALYETPGHALGKQLCPAGGFPKLDRTAREREALWRACGFDKQGVLTREEWMTAASPETGAAVYAFLLRQKTPSEKARQIAVLTAGVGARKDLEAKTAR